jgi:hypothetical protein
MIGQSQLRAGMLSVLIILLCLSRPNFLVPVHCGGASSIAIGWVFFWLLYIVRKGQPICELLGTICLVSRCPCTLLCLAPLCTPDVVGGVVILPSMSQLIT